jgi:predicted kinase
VTATLVTGAPCSGKNTYVDQHRKEGDLVVDYDALMMALSGGQLHQHSREIRSYAYDARDAVLRRWMRKRDTSIWVINSAPKRSMRDYYRGQGFEIVTMTAGLEACLARARAERPPAWQEYVRRYFRDYEPDRSAVYELAEELVDALKPPDAENSRRW